MRAFGGISPLPGNAGRGQADEEGAASGAVDVAGHPVAALLAAAREVSSADLLGAFGERGGDACGVHDARLGSGPAEPGP